MFFRSLRFRLTLWYAFALAVILTASGVFWYWYLARSLERHLDERLLIIAQDVTGFHRMVHGNEPVVKMPERDHCAGLEDFLRNHNWAEMVQIRSRAGQIVCSSNNLGPLVLPLPERTRRQVDQGTPGYENVILEQDSGESWRLLSFPIAIDGRAWGLVQVASNRSDIFESLQHLRLVLMTFSPLALAAMSLGGWFLAGRALSPVVQITRSMQRINAENLAQRLPVAESQDEIATLAETFNAMLARLDDAFRRIKQFSGDASHELRTPLTILKGETEVALRWAKSEEEFRNMLLSNMEEIHRMERIIEDLLLLAKSDAGELSLENQELSLSDLLQELYLQGRALAEGRQLEVLLRPEVDHEVRLRGDELRLRQLFLNLISNAVKYTPDPGRVEIILSETPEQAVVRVIDNGIGIPAEQQPHIFDRFYRVDEARNREAGGAGLGLAIVKGIVTAHDGSIEVRSNPGEGSEFIVRLPLRGPQQHPRLRLR